MKRMTQIKFYSLIWFLMVSFEASSTLPVFHVDAKDKTGVGIGNTLGKAFKKQFPDIEKTYDTYLGSFVVQEQFNEWVQKRVNVIKPNIDPAYRDEVNAIASTWTLSSQDQLGDGFLSKNEFWVIQLIPDIGRRTNCSGFGVWGHFSALNSPIVGRNMDWSTNEGLRSLQAITVYEYDNQSIVNIGFAGYVGVVSGFNSEGLFLAHLDSPLGKAYPEPPIGDDAIVFDLRKVLETKNRISTAARDLSKQQYGFSHNILMADTFDVQVLEQPQGQQANLRTDISFLRIEKSWEKVNQIAVVNCFALRSSPANCIRTVDGYRWNRFKTRAQFNRDNQAQVKDVSQIMFDTANPHQEIFNHKTVQSMVFTPKDKRLYLYSVPISGIHSTHPMMHEIIDLLPTAQVSKSWFNPINGLLVITALILVGVVIVGERYKYSK
ncbi:MAG TPA: hypothetical protein EYP59_13025 [Thiotrichaceae bacterium]|nr:hypothetical protein [Thiotrichaceae bacterium]